MSCFSDLETSMENFTTQGRICENWNFLVRSFHFSFMKILSNLCLHFARQDWQDRKKGKKNTLKWPKYKKPKDGNMG